MKTTYIFFIAIALLAYNNFLIKRDRELFKAYDSACAALPQPHPDCRYAK